MVKRGKHLIIIAQEHLKDLSGVSCYVANNKLSQGRTCGFQNCLLHRKNQRL